MQIFPDGAKAHGLAKMACFSARRRHKRTYPRMFRRRFRIILRAFDASAQGASKNSRDFTTSSFSDSRGWQLPQVAPPPPFGRPCLRSCWRPWTLAFLLVNLVCYQHHSNKKFCAWERPETYNTRLMRIRDAGARNFQHFTVRLPYLKTREPNLNPTFLLLCWIILEPINMRNRDCWSHDCAH